MGRLAGFKYREIIKRAKRLGFKFDQQAAGSPEIWYNATTDRSTTIPNHPGDMPEGTLRAILRQADVTPDEFLNALVNLYGGGPDGYTGGVGRSRNLPKPD